MRIALLLSVLFVASLAHAQSVWVAPSTMKIRPSDPAGSLKAATLEAAKNEFEAFHLVVSGPATGVTMSVGALNGPAGATLPASNIHLFREAWMNVATRSNIAGDTGRWPDALIPAVDELVGETRNAFPIDVPAGEAQPIFVEVLVPAGAAPGVYSGAVHVVAGAFSADVPITLTVRAFALPSTASLKTAYGIGWSDACVAHFGSYQACGGDAGVQKMLTLYSRFALDHRVTLSEAVYSGPAPSGSGYDWASWDALYGPLLDGTAPTRLAGAKMTSMRYAWSSDSPHYGAWAQHFKQKGWFDRTFDYTCDEPPAGCSWSSIASRAALVHAGDPDFHTLTTTTLSQASTAGVLGALDTLVPVINNLVPRDTASVRSSYDAWLAGGAHRQLWWYQSCMSDGCFIVGGPETVGWPSYMIDAPATLNRAMEWESWLQRIGGELYYDTTYALPRGDAWGSQLYFGGNGDGTLFYPGTPAKIGGKTDIPVASLRLKMIREGMEDYEYLKLVADAGDPQFADQEAARLAPTSTTFTSDPAAIDGARHRLADRIETLLGLAPPLTTPPATPPTGPASHDGGAGPPATPPTGPSPNAPLLPNGNPTVASPVAHAGGCSAGGGHAPAATGLAISILLALGTALYRSRRRSR